MLNHPRLQPSAVCQLFHELQVRFVETCESVWPGLDHLTNAYHLLGNLRDASAHGGCQARHSKRGLGVLRQANGTIEDVGAQLTPVAAAGCATRQAELTVDWCAQHVEVIETKPFNESHSLKQRRIEINLVRRIAEQKSFSIRRSEREPLTPGDKRIGNDTRRFSFGCLCA